MAANRWLERAFIEQVAAQHRCEVHRSRGGGDWELRADTDGIGWRCRLRPAGSESPPEIRWLATTIRFDEQRPAPLVISRQGVGGEGGGWDVTAGGWVGAAASAAVLGLGRWTRRRAERAEPAERATAPVGPDPGASPAPVSVLGPAWSVQDPAGVVDTTVAPWFTAFPPAWRGGAAAREEEPAPIDSVWLSNDGLEVASSGWWDSAPALDHQIRLGLALAHRVRLVRGF